MIGIVILALPLNDVAVPVTPPLIPIVLAVAKVVAVEAFPESAPINVDAVIGAKAPVEIVLVLTTNPELSCAKIVCV